MPLTDEFLEKNPEVYRELHKQIFKEEAPAKPRKKDIEALNAAVQNEKGNAETFAAAYRTAREAAGKEYMQKLNDLREKVMQSKADAMNLQKEAWDLARLRLPVEEQSAFVRSILDNKMSPFFYLPPMVYLDFYRHFTLKNYQFLPR